LPGPQRAGPPPRRAAEERGVDEGIHPEDPSPDAGPGEQVPVGGDAVQAAGGQRQHLRAAVVSRAGRQARRVAQPRQGRAADARHVIEIGYGGNERLVMNMGPQHPSAHGVFRAILTLEGETVVAVDAVIGYLHRCHEKLAETLTYVQYPSIASKTDYVSAMTAELAYVAAVEKVGKIDVPKRAQYLRVLVAELQRVASHCLWLGTWCLDMGGALGGGATVFLYAIRERELIL